jgi:3-phenylpropionate/trans-cinnamate dioxygenase ferredoxin subunit
MSRWIKIGTLADFPEGKPVVHDFRYESAVLVRVGDTIYAIEDRCSHEDVPLSEGEVDGCQIICPRHGARFDLRTGEALTMPAVEDLPAYEVRIEGDEVQVNGEL